MGRYAGIGMVSVMHGRQQGGGGRSEEAWIGMQQYQYQPTRTRDVQKEARSKHHVGGNNDGDISPVDAEREQLPVGVGMVLVLVQVSVSTCAVDNK